MIPLYLVAKTVCRDDLNIKTHGMEGYAAAAPIKALAWAFGDAEPVCIGAEPHLPHANLEDFRTLWIEYQDALREKEPGAMPVCVIGHHAKFMHAVWAHQIKLPPVEAPNAWGDTEVLAKACWPGRRSYSLAAIAKDILGIARMNVDPFEGKHTLSDLMAQAVSDVGLIRKVHLAGVAFANKE
jgi:hypothetical protein